MRVLNCLTEKNHKIGLQLLLSFIFYLWHPLRRNQGCREYSSLRKMTDKGEASALKDKEEIRQLANSHVRDWKKTGRRYCQVIERGILRDSAHYDDRKMFWPSTCGRPTGKAFGLLPSPPSRYCLQFNRPTQPLHGQQQCPQSNSDPGAVNQES